MPGRLLVIITGLIGTTVLAQTPELSFRAAGDGVFAFDTGQVRGRLRADAKSEGITSLVDIKTGVEIAKGDILGMFNYYRLLTPGRRFGESAWTASKTARLLADGGVEVRWPPQDDWPLEMTATFRWRTPNAIDVESVVTPQRDLPKFELFVGSYFSEGFRSLVYVRPTRHSTGEAGFLAADVCPLLDGTYLAFPRDWQAAQMFYDGRWEQGKNPVHWAVTRYIAAPLAMRRHPKSDVAAVFMSRPQDCFAIDCSYNKEPADGVAGHYSTYLSLFGEDLKAAKPARALMRLVVGQGISPARALELYEEFVREAK